MRCPRVDSGIGKQTSFGISARDGAAMSQCRSIHGLARSLARSLVRPAHLNGGGEAAAVQHRPKLGLEVPAALPRDHSRQIQFSLLYGRESEFSCKLYIFLHKVWGFHPQSKKAPSASRKLGLLLPEYTCWWLWFHEKKRRASKNRPAAAEEKMISIKMPLSERASKRPNYSTCR